MKQIKSKQKRLIISCAKYFALYTLIIVLLYSLFQYLVNFKVGSSFFTIVDLLLYKDALDYEEYAKIPAKNSKNSAFIIFDASGSTVYASNRTINERIFYEDLEMLGDYNSRRFFDVFENTAPDGSVTYSVFLSIYGSDDTVPKIVDSCVLDAQYHIISGTLFPDKKFLTQREFQLLNGISAANGTLEKYVYTTDSGQERTLAFFTFNMTQKKYEHLLQSANMIWLVGIPCILAAIVLFTIAFSRTLKRQIDPLYEAIYQERQRLIADISHDLKTPLTVIQGYARALYEHRVPESKKPRYLEAIVNKSDMAAGMVNDLFLFTQMAHPDYELHMESLDFNEFIKQFFAEKYMDLTESGFELCADIPDDSYIMLIDPVLMRRCFENLLNNALKYNPPGTSIYISVQKIRREITIIVADDGSGIPEEIAETLFQPFTTGNKARTSGKGTGLGLSIAQKIIEMHHGHIRLAVPPREPYHTEFIITLPPA